MFTHTRLVIQEILNTQFTILRIVRRLVEHERDQQRFKTPDQILGLLDDSETRMKVLFD